MERKLKLSLEDLSVDTFSVEGGSARRRGTVFGHTDTMGGMTCEFTCQGHTCEGSCERTCGLSCDWSCNGTCEWSCGGTCEYSCGGTCVTCDHSCNYSCNCVSMGGGGGGTGGWEQDNNQIGC